MIPFGLSHSYDEGPDLAAYARASRRGAARKLGPVLAEASALPTEDGIRRHDDQRLPPPGPDLGQAGPEQAVSRAELRSADGFPVDGELLAERQVLDRELAVAADNEGKESE
jgi:hypothetical protein